MNNEQPFRPSAALWWIFVIVAALAVFCLYAVERRAPDLVGPYLQKGLWPTYVVAAGVLFLLCFESLNLRRWRRRSQEPAWVKQATEAAERRALLDTTFADPSILCDGAHRLSEEAVSTLTRRWTAYLVLIFAVSACGFLWFCRDISRRSHEAALDGGELLTVLSPVLFVSLGATLGLTVLIVWVSLQGRKAAAVRLLAVEDHVRKLAREGKISARPVTPPDPPRRELPTPQPLAPPERSGPAPTGAARGGLFGAVGPVPFGAVGGASGPLPVPVGGAGLFGMPPPVGGPTPGGATVGPRSLFDASSPSPSSPVNPLLDGGSPPAPQSGKGPFSGPTIDPLPELPGSAFDLNESGGAARGPSAPIRPRRERRR